MTERERWYANDDNNIGTCRTCGAIRFLKDIKPAPMSDARAELLIDIALRVVASELWTQDAELRRLLEDGGFIVLDPWGDE